MSEIDERGWPVRMLEGRRVCARAECVDHDGDRAEFRIDGYCSLYCRDIDECEAERDAAVSAAVQSERASSDAWWGKREAQQVKTRTAHALAALEPMQNGC